MLFSELSMIFLYCTTPKLKKSRVARAILCVSDLVYMKALHQIFNIQHLQLISATSKNNHGFKSMEQLEILGKWQKKSRGIHSLVKVLVTKLDPLCNSVGFLAQSQWQLYSCVFVTLCKAEKRYIIFPYLEQNVLLILFF